MKWRCTAECPWMSALRLKIGAIDRFNVGALYSPGKADIETLHNCETTRATK